jgi:hypothetical protein
MKTEKEREREREGGGLSNRHVLQAHLLWSC